MNWVPARTARFPAPPTHPPKWGMAASGAASGAAKYAARAERRAAAEDARSTGSGASTLSRISGVSRALHMTDLYPEKYKELRAFVDQRKADLRAMRREIAEWSGLLETARRHVAHDFAEGEPRIQVYFEDDVEHIEGLITAIEARRETVRGLLSDMAKRVCNDLQALEYIAKRRSQDISRLETRLGAGYLGKNVEKLSHFIDRSVELEDRLREVREAVRSDSEAIA